MNLKLLRKLKLSMLQGVAMKINNNIIYRFESTLEEGVLFIFDIKHYKTYKGSNLEHYILRQIDNGADVTEIIDSIYNEYHIENCRENIEMLIEDFANKGIIVI